MHRGVVPGLRGRDTVTITERRNGSTERNMAAVVGGGVGNIVVVSTVGMDGVTRLMEAVVVEGTGRRGIRDTTMDIEGERESGFVDGRCCIDWLPADVWSY